MICVCGEHAQTNLMELGWKTPANICGDKPHNAYQN